MFNQKQVAKEVFSLMFDFEWEDLQRKDKALKDLEWTLSFIVQSVKFDNQKILYNYYLWMKKIFSTYKLDIVYLDQMFDIFKKHLKEKYNFCVDELIDSLPFNADYNPITLENNAYDLEMKKYLNYLLSSRRSEAKEYIHSLVEGGMKLEDIYLFVFQESLRVVGEMWLNGEISVAMEHYFTACTQYIMSTLYDHVISETTGAHRVLACAVGSELHEVGIRMVADLFELSGWDSRYLGASVPTQDIVKYAIDFQPHVIALSITMGYHVENLKEVVESLKLEPSLKNTRIIIGGLPFVNNEQLFEKMGADAYAIDALEGIRLANELV